MTQPNRRLQISLWNAFLALTLISLLILPGQYALRWAWRKAFRPTVSVPDGGKLLIGGRIVAPAAPSVSWGAGQRNASKGTRVNMSVTPRVIIHDEEESIARSYPDFTRETATRPIQNKGSFHEASASGHRRTK